MRSNMRETSFSSSDLKIYEIEQRIVRGRGERKIVRLLTFNSLSFKTNAIKDVLRALKKMLEILRYSPDVILTPAGFVTDEASQNGSEEADFNIVSNLYNQFKKDLRVFGKTAVAIGIDLYFNESAVRQYGCVTSSDGNLFLAQKIYPTGEEERYLRSIGYCGPRIHNGLAVLVCNDATAFSVRAQAQLKQGTLRYNWYTILKKEMNKEWCIVVDLAHSVVSPRKAPSIKNGMKNIVENRNGSVGIIAFSTQLQGKELNSVRNATVFGDNLEVVDLMVRKVRDGS